MGVIPFIPGFPAYSGPFSPVGSLDVESPISEISPQASSPDPTISTVSFRIYYPSSKSNKNRESLYWIEEPQQEHVSAFARFLGASHALSNAISYIPSLLYFTKIPALKNARLLNPEPDSRRCWPVVVFSHGLGGSRNSYSYICGLLASYGVVVIAPEHRDGSAPISFVRDKAGHIVHRIEYRAISHTACQEVHDARNEQLSIRLFELELVYQALLKLNEGSLIRNHAVAHTSNPSTEGLMQMFSDKLDLRPGKITWIGHSFGAASICQFVKSVYWRPSGIEPETYVPIYVPSKGSDIVKQITPGSTVILLDPWSLPLTNPRTKWLFEKPLPGYQREYEPGRNILAVLSEAFYKWNANLVTIKKVLSSNPSIERQRHTLGTGPHIFYPQKAAHLSQSDFGILFPTLTKYAVKSTEPGRILCLNIRAILEVMRLNNIDVADTSSADMDMPASKKAPQTQFQIRHGAFDRDILKTDGSVRGWIALRVAEEELDQEGIDTETPVNAKPIIRAVGDQ